MFFAGNPEKKLKKKSWLNGGINTLDILGRITGPNGPNREKRFSSRVGRKDGEPLDC